jgi:hypothetical protein
MTESPRFQLAGTETPLPSMVCKASKIRINSDCGGHAFLLVETWLAAGLPSVVSRRVFQARGNPRRWPAAGRCISYVRIRGLRVELETHPQRAAATATAAATERAGMVRDVCHISSRKRRVPGFHSFKHRTGGFRCQTTICECVRVDHRVEQQAREIKKEKTRETRSSDFLFLGSTDPVANERLFLERFTCFQQGQARE